MASQAKAASDNRTVGFVALESCVPLDDKRRLCQAELSLFRDGKALWVLQPEKIIEVDWAFRDDGNQVAIASAGMHGMTFFQLFDVVTGRLLEAANSATVP